MKKKNSDLFVVIAALNITAMLVSNITAFKMIQLGPLTLPAAVFVFPLTYILGDVIVEVYGLQKAKNLIWISFSMNLLVVLYFKFAVALPSPVWFEHSDAFALVLSSTPRVLIAGFIAFLAGSFLNATVMSKLRARDGEKRFAWRAIISTIFGEGIDAMIFITVAFLGTMPNSALLTMVVSQAGFKIAYEIIVLPITATVVNKVRAAEANY